MSYWNEPFQDGILSGSLLVEKSPTDHAWRFFFLPLLRDTVLISYANDRLQKCAYTCSSSSYPFISHSTWQNEKKTDCPPENWYGWLESQHSKNRRYNNSNWLFVRHCHIHFGGKSHPENSQQVAPTDLTRNVAIKTEIANVLFLHENNRWNWWSMRCSPINLEAKGGFLFVKIDDIQCMFCVYCPRIEHEKDFNPSASQQKHGVEKRGHHEAWAAI